MLTVLWSTPRTGSTWYSYYLYEQLSDSNKKVTFLRQYLNEFHIKSYIKNGDPDLLMTFEPYSYYLEYYLDPLAKRILTKNLFEPRWRTTIQEEDYRIKLLESHNLKKFPTLIHQHVSPMSIKSYSYLRNKADRNIFLYRRNFIDQVSSYALAMHTSIFRKQGPQHNIPVLQNVTVDRQLLSGLTERIKDFYMYDKTGCEVLYYEDIDFTKRKNTEKQNKVRPFDQLSDQTKLDILELNEEFMKFTAQQKIV